MKIDRAGIPFILIALSVGALLIALGFLKWAFPFMLLVGAFVFFFRDPDRTVPKYENVVVAPADGRIVYAGPSEHNIAPVGSWKQVSIFLSPLDVHVNRTPIGGKVIRVKHKPGRFLPAYRKEASRDNEYCETWINHNGRIVIFRQIVGLLARRVVCRLKPGMVIGLGQRFGIMKFGSRMDVFIQEEVLLQVQAGDSVRGGETILAKLGKHLTEYDAMNVSTDSSIKS